MDKVGRMAINQIRPEQFSQSGRQTQRRQYCECAGLIWNELATTDTTKAGAFYSGLFGWGLDKQTFGPMEYTIFQNGERGAGGMFELTPEMAGVPPHWLAYFSVDDCDAKVKKATELGAKTIKPADDIPGVGRFAILQDPQGAVFAVIKTEPASA